MDFAFCIYVGTMCYKGPNVFDAIYRTMRLPLPLLSISIIVEPQADPEYRVAVCIQLEMMVIQLLTQPMQVLCSSRSMLPTPVMQGVSMLKRDLSNRNSWRPCFYVDITGVGHRRLIGRVKCLRKVVNRQEEGKELEGVHTYYT
jgi:hypothetical protein